MTANQIAYWNLVETQRSNRTREQETFRSNVAREQETYRSNLAQETETNRSNVARETETNRHNVATEGIQTGQLRLDQQKHSDMVQYKYVPEMYLTQERQLSEAAQRERWSYQNMKDFAATATEVLKGFGLMSGLMGGFMPMLPVSNKDNNDDNNQNPTNGNEPLALPEASQQVVTAEPQEDGSIIFRPGPGWDAQATTSPATNASGGESQFWKTWDGLVDWGHQAKYDVSKWLYNANNTVNSVFEQINNNSPFNNGWGVASRAGGAAITGWSLLPMLAF